MKIGTICYSCHSGLGHLARDFYEHGVISKILIVPHRHYPNYPEWYPKEDQFSHRDADKFLDEIDALLVFENAFHWDVVKKAQKQGKMFVIMPMYEYTPIRQLKANPPDLVLCPSLLDVDVYKGEFPTQYLPVPVDMQWKRRERARTFVHNAGHAGWEYRNGTPELLAAIPHIKNDVQLIIRGQPEDNKVRRLLSNPVNDDRVKVEMREVSNTESLFDVGDVLVAPERYNGLSLPLQEAYASGMLVMTTDRYPMNTWLPNEPLLPVRSTENVRIEIEFERCILDPEQIAKTIDMWYDADITEWSERGKWYGQQHSWNALKQSYLEIFEG